MTYFRLLGDDLSRNFRLSAHGINTQAAQGLHCLLVQPDDSGITYSGFWLLRSHP